MTEYPEGIKNSHRESAYDALMRIDRSIFSGKRVLDVGCGGCQFKPVFETLGCVWSGVGKVRHTDDAQVKNGLMEDLWMYQDAEFDFVFVCHAFEHCERPFDALREFKRVCKAGGAIMILTPPHCERMIQAGDRDHIFVWTREQAQKASEYIGWKAVEIWDEIPEGREDVPAYQSMVWMVKNDF